MERDPKVSIIMPTYNAQKYIEKTIESILNQTFNDYDDITMPMRLEKEAFF